MRYKYSAEQLERVKCPACFGQGGMILIFSWVVCPLCFGSGADPIEKSKVRLSHINALIDKHTKTIGPITHITTAEAAVDKLHDDRGSW